MQRTGFLYHRERQEGQRRKEISWLRAFTLICANLRSCNAKTAKGRRGAEKSVIRVQFVRLRALLLGANRCQSVDKIRATNQSPLQICAICEICGFLPPAALQLRASVALSPPLRTAPHDWASGHWASGHRILGANRRQSVDKIRATNQSPLHLCNLRNLWFSSPICGHLRSFSFGVHQCASVDKSRNRRSASARRPSRGKSAPLCSMTSEADTAP